MAEFIFFLISYQSTYFLFIIMNGGFFCAIQIIIQYNNDRQHRENNTASCCGEQKREKMIGVQSEAMLLQSTTRFWSSLRWKMETLRQSNSRLFGSRYNNLSDQIHVQFANKRSKSKNSQLHSCFFNYVAKHFTRYLLK